MPLSTASVSLIGTDKGSTLTTCCRTPFSVSTTSSGFRSVTGPPEASEALTANWKVFEPCADRTSQSASVPRRSATNRVGFIRRRGIRAGIGEVKSPAHDGRQEITELGGRVLVPLDTGRQRAAPIDDDSTRRVADQPFIGERV